MLILFMVIFFFIESNSKEHKVLINGNIFIYNEDLLKEIIKYDEIFLVNYPGSYTGIRKSIAITTGIRIFNPNIKIYSINLLKDFATLFFKQNKNSVFFLEKHIIHYYKINSDIVLKPISELEDILKDKSSIGNVINSQSEIIDFSLENVYKHIKSLNLNDVKQEYYDKFSV